MTFFEVIAIFGALAWLPHIIQLIREKLKKPILKIISDNQVEIGYTTLGPILNINFAFLSENIGSLINKIDLQLVHESNETQPFMWMWYEESLFQMDLPKMPINYKKNQKAIALNVPLNVLVEKRIGFQNVNFKREADEITKLLNEDSVNLKNSGKESAELKSYSSYNRVIDFAQNSFPWKKGLYTAKFSIYLAETSETFKHNFKFQLSNLDNKTIYNNIDRCKSFIEKIFIDVDEELVEDWKWVYVNKLSETEEIRIKNQSKI